MDLEERIKLITRNTAEVVTLDELKTLLETNDEPRAYLGFEPSGLFHIGWLIWAYKVKDFVDAGIRFILLEATWHAWINDKLGGNIDLIRKDAKYVEHVLRAIGIDTSKIEIVDAEEMAGDKDYWGIVLRVGKANTLARIRRALTIMGRKSSEAEFDSSKMIYPLMQVADIYYLDVDIALGGTDQRKAHMLARDTAEKLKRKKIVAIHTPLLTGLQGVKRMDIDEEVFSVEYKMSKSRPESSILVHDSPEEIEQKIMKAYCPPKTITYNPVLEINKYLLFRDYGFTLVVERPEKYGGTIVYTSYEELERDYVAGKLHPLDLKKATARALSELLEPVREYFEKNKEARELLELLSKTTITR